MLDPKADLEALGKLGEASAGNENALHLRTTIAAIQATMHAYIQEVEMLREENKSLLVEVQELNDEAAVVGLSCNCDGSL